VFEESYCAAGAQNKATTKCKDYQAFFVFSSQLKTEEWNLTDE
jgi:hypothetical protein